MCKWGNNTRIIIEQPGSQKEIIVDSCLADLIIKLNQIGLYTLSSCCGHHKEGASIIFHNKNGRILHENITVENGYFEIFANNTKNETRN